MENKFLLLTISILIYAMSSVAQVTGTFTDSRDGKEYKTVTIGTQTWMAENLAYKTKTGCFAYDNDSNNVAVFGYYYFWETAKEACPEGWHFPTKAEWDTLIHFLGGSEIAGGKLKSNSFWFTKKDSISGYSHVHNCSHKDTEEKHDSVLINSTKFNGLPGGGYYNNDLFNYKGIYATWWTSTEFNSFSYYTFYIPDNSAGIYFTMGKKHYAFNVRCVKN